MNENALKQLSQEEIIDYRQKIIDQKMEYSKKIENCLYQNFHLIVNSYKEINALEDKLSQFSLIFDEQKSAIHNLISIIGLKNDNINSVNTMNKGDCAIYLIDFVQNLPLGYNELKGRTVIYRGVLLGEEGEMNAIVIEDALLLCTKNESSELIYNSHYSLSDITIRCLTSNDTNKVYIEIYKKSTSTTCQFHGLTEGDTRDAFDNIKKTQLQAGKFIQKTDTESLLSSVENLPEMETDLTITHSDDVEQINPATFERVKSLRLYLLKKLLIVAERGEDKFVFVNMTDLSLVDWDDLEEDSNNFSLRMDDTTFCLMADTFTKKEKWKNLLYSSHPLLNSANSTFNSISDCFDISLQSHDFLSATQILTRAEPMTSSNDTKRFLRMRDKLIKMMMYEVESILEKPARAQFCDLGGLVGCLVDLGVTEWTVETFLRAKSREMRGVVRGVRLECDFREFLGSVIEVGCFFIVSTFIQFRRVFAKEPKSLALCLVWVRNEFISLLHVIFGHLFDTGKDIFTIIHCIDNLTSTFPALSSYGLDLVPEFHLTIIEPLSRYLTDCTKTWIRGMDPASKETSKLISFSNGATCVKFTQKYLDSLPNLKTFVAGNVLRVTQSQWALSQRNGKFIRGILSLPVDNCYEVIVEIVYDVMMAHMNILSKKKRAGEAGDLMECDVEFVVGCFLHAICDCVVGRFGLGECPSQLKKLENYFKTPT